MKIFDFIRQSIGLMQAILLLTSSIIIGLILSFVEVHSALQQQRIDIKQHADEMLTLTLGGATNAAWSLDTKLAREVATGLTKQAGIKHVEIRANLRNGEEQTLFKHHLMLPDYGQLTHWAARKFFSDLSQIHRTLTVEQSGDTLKVGTLLVDFAPQYQAQRFLYAAAYTVTASLLEACLIGLILFFITQWLITIPIRRAAYKIEQINPDILQNEDYRVMVPSLHREDEIGQLLQHTNQLLDRLNIYHNKLRLLATKDSLTGLANRVLIQEYLANMIANAKRNHGLVAVIFIDLDRFKYINDTFGHEIGDKLLKYVSISLLRQTREQDAIGRLGGDEFLLIMPTKGIIDVMTMAERILEVLSKPFNIDGYELRVNASLGISMYPNDGEDAGTLMRCADLAMYKAKEHKSSQWHLFSESMKLKLEQGLALETALVSALKNDELEMYLQPQYRANSMQLAGCEALLRWHHNGEFVPPDKFIEVAEITGLIGEIGDWVLSRACQTIQNWGERAVPVSVNVSGQQLADENFVNDVLTTVKRYQIAPSMIEFEITETMLMENLDKSFERLAMLREKGFRISIDDFGTGYSSLSYLSQLPIDALKIDRSFVSGTEQSSIVLTTIIALAKALGIDVVAEGVETENQQSLLIENGCDLLQGYLLGKPMPRDQFDSECLFKTVDISPKPFKVVTQ